MFPLFINPFAVLLSLSTATGVFLHDMHIDSMATAVMASGHDSVIKTISLSNDPHTHSERHSLSQSVHDLKTQHPRVRPRSDEDKKHLLQKHAGRGHHPFDNYNLPLI